MGFIIYVGDHVADVIFSRNIAEQPGPSSTVISVVVTYSGAVPSQTAGGCNLIR
jgi:hypothetical protein